MVRGEGNVPPQNPARRRRSGQLRWRSLGWPQVGEFGWPPGSPSKSLSPGGFLEVTEKLDGICVIAVNKLLPGDMFEFVIARSSPQALFPNVTWANPPRHQSFI